MGEGGLKSGKKCCGIWAVTIDFTVSASPKSPLCLLSWRNKKVGPAAGDMGTIDYIKCIVAK